MLLPSLRACRYAPAVRPARAFVSEWNLLSGSENERNEWSANWPDTDLSSGGGKQRERETARQQCRKGNRQGRWSDKANPFVRSSDCRLSVRKSDRHDASFFIVLAPSLARSIVASVVAHFAAIRRATFRAAASCVRGKKRTTDLGILRQAVNCLGEISGRRSEGTCCRRPIASCTCIYFQLLVKRSS